MVSCSDHAHQTPELLVPGKGTKCRPNRVWVFGNFSLFKTPFLGWSSLPTSFVSFFCLLYFFLPVLEDNDLLFWVPDVLCQHSEVLLSLLSLEMLFWLICERESGLPVLFLCHLRTALSRHYFWLHIRNIHMTLNSQPLFVHTCMHIQNMCACTYTCSLPWPLFCILSLWLQYSISSLELLLKYYLMLYNL